MFYIKDVTICTPDEVIEDGAVLVENGRIQAVGQASAVSRPAAAQVIAGQGHFLVPGFIDLQFNGAFGIDFTQEPERIWEVAARLPRYGLTSFLPTIITAPPETVRRAQAVLAQGPPAGFRGAFPLGLHVEGPFLNPGKKGAHDPALLRPPSLEAVADWSPETAVCLVTLAPELPGALEVVAALVARGVTVSAGHSLATYEEAQAGFAAGISYCTHLFNAMTPVRQREPGLAVAALTDERVTVGLIPDGVHVHPALVRLVWAAVGNGRLTLVTDAMAALGMPAGTYRLGDFEVTVDGTTARLADGTLAGSLLAPDTAVRNLMAFTACTLAQAVTAVTRTPARVLGLENRKGRIAPGFDADLVFLTKDFRVADVILSA